MTNTRLRLPAEWEKHTFTLIIWPGISSPWNYMIKEVQQCYVGIIDAIARHEPLVIITNDKQSLESCLSNMKHPNIHVFECEVNDTWARDNAFITMIDAEGHAHLFDFQFNGWGLKFASAFDNQINANLFRTVLKGNTYHSALRTVLEGGSIESDGKNTILTSSSCLLASNRNCYKSKADAENELKGIFEGYRFLWIDNKPLIGDDTDGHIDTMARFAPEDTIVYVQSANPNDSQHTSLTSMEAQLRLFRTADGNPYRLVALPSTPPIFDNTNGERLPATYANFYFVDGAILMPTYNVETDAKALSIMKNAFPSYSIEGVDCRALICQHGSLHCSTMQFPFCVTNSMFTN